MIAALVSLSSCSRTEKQIFDKSAAERLEEYKTIYSNALTANGGKWVMEYFANGDEEGYIFVVTFSKDGSVKVSSANQWIGDTYKTDTSCWEMIADDGPVLTFNTYNQVFHLFSTPEDIPGTYNPDTGADISEQGTGHAGDYEFIVMNVSDDGNTIRLKGKKRGYDIWLRHLDASTDDATYLATATDARKNLFNASLGHFILTGSDGERYVMTKDSIAVFHIYPELGDEVTQTTTANAIITPTGMHFMNKCMCVNAAGTDSIEFQYFTIQNDGTLLCDDGKTTIRADKYSKVFLNEDATWIVNTASGTGNFGSYFTALTTDLSAYMSSTLRYIHISYDSSKEAYRYIVGVKSKIGSKFYNLDLTFYFDGQATGDEKVNMTFVSFGSNAETYYNKVAALKSIIDAMSSEFTIVSERPMNPKELILTSTNGSFSVAL